MILLEVDNPKSIETAVSIISEGGIIVYPTDTLYGFGADAKNDSAIDTLNKIKNRKGPMSVLTDNDQKALSWADVSSDKIKLISSKLVGYTTIIFPVKKGIVSDKILGPNQTLGVRKPNHIFCIQLAASYGNPITTTSVNRHGNPSFYDPVEIISEFGEEIDLFINGGKLESDRGSSIFKLENNYLVQIRS